LRNSPNPELRTPNPELRTPNPERSTVNVKRLSVAASLCCVICLDGEKN
jgi:hypothetical protein